MIDEFNLYRQVTICRTLPNTNAAFILSFNRELDLDAGAAYMFATLGTGLAVEQDRIPACELSLLQEDIYFSICDVRGLTDELAVTLSDGLLPDPETCGSNSLEGGEFLLYSGQVKNKKTADDKMNTDERYFGI